MISNQIDIKLASLTDTENLGRVLGTILTIGDVITLAGSLGAGKTTLARSIIATATGETDVASPTFGLVQSYKGPSVEVIHFDLYRLEASEEIWELGIEDALADGATLI